MNLKKLCAAVFAAMALTCVTVCAADYTESFAIAYSGSTKADSLNENAIVIRNNRNISDKSARGANLREAYLKIDVSDYAGQYPVKEAKLRLFLKTRPSNTGVSSDNETPTCDVYAFGTTNTDWQQDTITYTSAMSDGVRPDIDELSEDLQRYEDNPQCGYLDMISFDATSSLTDEYMYDITPFVNDLLQSGRTAGTICLMQAGGSISRESTVMQFYCEDTAGGDSTIIPSVVITPYAKANVQLVRNFSVSAVPYATLLCYNNTEDVKNMRILGVITDADGKLYEAAVIESAVNAGGRGAARLNFTKTLPSDISGFDLRIFTLDAEEEFTLINRSVLNGSINERSVSGTAVYSGYPEITDLKVVRNAASGTITVSGSLVNAPDGVEIAVRAYADEDYTSQNQAFASTETQNGEFAAQLHMPDFSGEYSIIIGGLNIAGEKKTEGVMYFDSTQSNAALEMVNAAQTTEELAKIIGGKNDDGYAYTDILAVDYAAVLEIAGDETRLDDFCKYLLGLKDKSEGGFEDIDALHMAMKEAADIGAISAAMTVTAQVRGLVEEFVSESVMFKSLYCAEQPKLSSEIKDMIIAKVIGEPYSDREALLAAFDDACAVTALTKVLYQDVLTVLKLCEDMIGFDIYVASNYNELTKDSKTKVLKLFSDADINSCVEVKGFFDKEVAAAAKNEKKPVTTAGGGGGGRTPSGGTVVIAQPQEITPSISEPVRLEEISVFSDLEGYDWAKSTINSLYKKGIVAKADNFRPYDRITRAEFVKMLIGAAGMDNDAAECEFVDTQKGMWHYSSIASAYEKGIASGISADEFGVARNITRQEMSALAYRTICAAGANPALTDCDFADADDISDWALTAVCALKNAGIINGVDNNRFAPLDNATRAEAAIIINAISEYLENGEGQ